MPLLQKAEFVCFDCETTGLDTQNDRIIEVALVHFTLSKVIKRYETLIDPQCPIPQKSSAIHNITSEMLVNKPKIAEVFPDLLHFLQSGILVGHGIAFDIDMLFYAAKRIPLACSLKDLPSIDTLRLARYYGDSNSNSLENLAEHFNVPKETAHRAMNDVSMNIGVFKHLVKKFKTTEQIFETLAKPIKMRLMPLGKYKGRPFSEIPLSYLEWASHKDFDQDLTYSIRSELKMRKKRNVFSQVTNPFLKL